MRSLPKMPPLSNFFVRCVTCLQNYGRPPKKTPLLCCWDQHHTSLVPYRWPGSYIPKEGGRRFHHLYLAQSSTTDRKSTRLNSSHVRISYAVFCLKKKKKK